MPELRVIRTLSDVCLAERELHVQCCAGGCRRGVAIDPRPLLVLFTERRWSFDLAEASNRFTCRICGGKNVRVSHRPVAA